MIRVSKEMLDIIRTNTSTEKRKAEEIKVMTNKLDHARKAYDMIMKDRETTNAKIPAETQRIKQQN